MYISERCGEMDFSLCRRNGDALVDVVANFKYLGRALDQTDGNWPAVRRNYKQVQRVWGKIDADRGSRGGWGIF